MVERRRQKKETTDFAGADFRSGKEISDHMTLQAEHPAGQSGYSSSSSTSNNLSRSLDRGKSHAVDDLDICREPGDVAEGECCCCCDRRSSETVGDSETKVEAVEAVEFLRRPSLERRMLSLRTAFSLAQSASLRHRLTIV